MIDPATDPVTDPFERELRRTLAAHADDAPDPHALTDRLLAAGASVDGPATVGPVHSRGWRTWGTPLVAAACVVAIAGIVLAIVRPGHVGHGPDAADTRSASVPSTVTSAPAAPTSASPTALSTGTATAQTPDGVLVPLRNVRVADLTFTSVDSGWALASADCLAGSGRCTAVLRTTNGTTWTSFPNSTQFDVPGVSAGCPAVTCVQHIRFANSRIGYAFGPDAFYLSSDGGRTWQKQSGGADALETLNDNVIRLSTRTQVISVSTSDIGSSSWTERTLPGGGSGMDSATLVRTREAAYVVGLGDLAMHSPAVLWTSADDGATWSNRATPCPAGDGVTSSTGVAAASDNLVALICTPWDGGRPTLVIGNPSGSTSADHPLPGTAQASAFVVAVSGSTFLAGAGELYRTTDRGASWHPCPSVDVSAGVTFAGFESPQVGRLVTDNGQIVWTTHDAGAHWTKASL